jgi:hypothetical protein
MVLGEGGLASDWGHGRLQIEEQGMGDRIMDETFGIGIRRLIRKSVLVAANSLDYNQSNVLQKEKQHG